MMGIKGQIVTVRGRAQHTGIAILHPLAIDVAVTPSETVLNLHTTIALVITLKALIALCTV